MFHSQILKYNTANELPMKTSIFHQPINRVTVLVFVVATSISLIGMGTNHRQITSAQQPSINLTSTEQKHLQDGISFQIDDATFSHHTATVNGIQLHYVTGGKGDPVV